MTTTTDATADNPDTYHCSTTEDEGGLMPTTASTEGRVVQDSSIPHGAGRRQRTRLDELVQADLAADEWLAWECDDARQAQLETSRLRSLAAYRHIRVSIRTRATATAENSKCRTLYARIVPPKVEAE